MLGARKQLPYLLQSEGSHTYWSVSINCINMSFFWFYVTSVTFFIPLWPWFWDICAQSLVKTQAMNYVCKVFLFQTTCWWSDSEDKSDAFTLSLSSSTLALAMFVFGGGGASLTLMICAPAHRLAWSCSSSNISPLSDLSGRFRNSQSHPTSSVNHLLLR